MIARVVGACARRHRLTLVAAIVVCAGALNYAAGHFAIDTDSTRLIAEDAHWRQREWAFDAAFAHRTDLIAVVIDGATAELAEDAAAQLTARLAQQPSLFRAVWRPDGGPFFDRAGLLFQTTQELAQTTATLIAAQPLLGPLAADPSLRGVMNTLSQSVDGAAADPVLFARLVQPLHRLADAFDGIVAGDSPRFSWRELISARVSGPRELRRFVLAQPVLDYGGLQPGERAVSAIRKTARDLGLDSEQGVRVRLTGPVPLADEEFATLAEGAALNAALMIVAVLALLWIALRSWRLIAAVMLSLGAGLLVTTAFGLFVFGALNVISVAFAVLFVGLGVDFGIQFCMAYRTRRSAGDDLHAALRHAGSDIGGALALAAAAIAAGFYAFVPTEYRGVSELGVIAGTGMLVAFLTTITMLPALIALLRPPASRQFAAFSPVSLALVRHRRVALAVAAVIAAAGAAALPKLEFDFNPLHLRSGRVESVATLLDLMQDPDTTPDTLDVLAPSVADATALAARLAQLPVVDHVITLTSFVPEQQDAKLPLIDDAALLLEAVLNPRKTLAAASDDDNVRAMLRAAKSLEEAAAGQGDNDVAAVAKRLAHALRTLAQGDAAQRERARAMLIPGLHATLGQVRAAMQASPVTLENLPAEVRRDWVAADGRARIEVFPRNDAHDNASLRRFVDEVRQMAPDATGAPVSILESSRTIVRAFLQAGTLALVTIVVLLAATLRKVTDVMLTLAPVALSGLATLGLCVALGLRLNFANIIALPLLFGISVAFNIYFVMAWRAGKPPLLQGSLARAVIFSALTTGTAFVSLWLSNHPGTASMGKLLTLSLACTLVSALLFLPALLAEVSARRDRR